MRRKSTRWESQLWSCVGSGDGENCPLYDQCQNRLGGGWCISEHKEQVNQLFESSHFDYRNYDFLDFAGHCRIFELVEQLAQKYIEMGDVRLPPVPAVLVALFDNKRIEIREIPLKVYHGAIWQLKDSWIVHLSAKDASTKKKFTLFHEGFHILAHCAIASPVFRRKGTGAAAFNELLAEHFASCLLMPRKWVEENWAQLQDVGKTAEIFDVPQPAVRIRLKLLGLI